MNYYHGEFWFDLLMVLPIQLFIETHDFQEDNHKLGQQIFLLYIWKIPRIKNGLVFINIRSVLNHVKDVYLKLTARAIARGDIDPCLSVQSNEDNLLSDRNHIDE